MSKPRVIIADTDANYVIRLQTKFAEEFLDDIDLEIITDLEYFHLLFQSPQKVNILIVAEEMFDPSLQKHNIGSIFLMTEQITEGMTTDLRENRIFKYSSIREIFNEITGKGANSLKFERNIRQKPKLIVVTSAIGGAGKTITAMGICAGLFRQYKRTLYIDAEQLQTFSINLEEQSPITDHAAYMGLMQKNGAIYQALKSNIRTEVFDYLPPFRASLLSLGLEKNLYLTLVDQAKESGDYDYIVVDTDSVFDYEKAELMNRADRVVVVTTQSQKSLLATNRLMSNINDSNSDKYLYLCNNFDRYENNRLLVDADTPAPKFTVGEYVRHFAHADTMKAEELQNVAEYQKMAFLLL